MNDKYKNLSLILENNIPAYSRWVKGGLKAVSSTVNHAIYNQPQSRKGAFGASYATTVGIPLGKFLHTMYKTNKQKCKQVCRNKQCLKSCYSTNLDSIIKKINDDSSVLSTIVDPAIKKRMIAKFKRQMKLYVRKKQNLG